MGEDIFEELKALRYGWNEGYVWQKKRERRLEKTEGIKKGFCAILGGLT